MASKRGISYQWRFFVPTVIALWVIILGMALWQVHRVSQLKLETVYSQLEIVGNYISATYSDHRNPEPFINFVNDFYQASHSYDDLTIVVRDVSTGKIEKEIGTDINADFSKEIESTEPDMGMIEIPALNEALPHHHRYLYFRSITDDDKYEIQVMLPYSKSVSELVSASTARFWLVFGSIAILATIFAYISSVFVARNVRILTNFAKQAATNPHFVPNTSEIEFPSDELGDACRQIMVIYNQRIVEMERSNREHKVALNAINEKDRIKRELTSNINHELKTPVGVIQAYIDTIVETPDMDNETRDRFLQKVQDNVHRLTSLINDVTAVTKLESGGKLVNVEEVDYHDLVFKLANDLTENNLTGGMKFNYNIPLNCKVRANEGLLASMINNLVKNAAAYSQGTEMVLECVKQEPDFYHFRFYDNGIGVPPEHIPHLFERFYRVNAGRSRDTGGTGLGLAIVQVTVQTFGGIITVSNRQPHGLQFDFTLPKY